MRRRLPLLLAVAVVAASGWFALTLPDPVPIAGGEPRITRLFIPAIKAECRQRAGVQESADIGYTFTPDGALTTIDRSGALTGIDSARLARFNSCLARYPIEPIRAVPQDHYTRNLLYDYDVDVLAPCLAARVDALPPIPARSDFVVRLFSWDPFRALALRHPLDELLQLARACPAIPPFLAGG
ncbi:MAG TPA: hypothetical protein VNR36_10890 [Pseudolysinimonas sp.]|nr:hypothetical protein [Pseudolysinimonas sp.]